MATYFSDLHCHTTQFTYNRLLSNPWYESFNPIFPAQGDYSQLAKGNVRVVMASLYPIEQGFVTLKLLNLDTGDVTDFLANVIVKMPKERADKIQSPDHDYFEDLINELNFLHKSQQPFEKKVFLTPFKRKTFRYKIVKNFNELKSLLNLDDELNPGPACSDTIAVVLTIEGGNALGVGQKNTLQLSNDDLKAKLTINIDKLKKLAPPGGEEGSWAPLFISLCHHFWNQLGGHAVSLWKIIRKAMDQTNGINSEITDPGKMAIDQLLDNSGGRRRILIDTSHMSIKVRRWYYDYLEGRGDNIPVIVSHTGLNGFKTMAEAEMHGTPDKIHDIADEKYENSNEFNPWDVFITDEEILKIHKSGGLIGLNLDERIMMGKKTLDKTKKDARFKSAEKKRIIWIKPLINEILHIARYLSENIADQDKIWDNICIGSDFNGMITPVKAFKTATDFPELNDTLLSELKKMAVTEPLLTGKTTAEIEKITDKIMWKNNLLFLEKHFHF